MQLTDGTTEPTIPNDFHDCHGFLLYHQVVLINDGQQVLLELLAQIISSLAFEFIRMQHQLAYGIYLGPKVDMNGTV